MASTRLNFLKRRNRRRNISSEIVDIVDGRKEWLTSEEVVMKIYGLTNNWIYNLWLRENPLTKFGHNWLFVFTDHWIDDSGDRRTFGDNHGDQELLELLKNYYTKKTSDGNYHR